MIGRHYQMTATLIQLRLAGDITSEINIASENARDRLTAVSLMPVSIAGRIGVISACDAVVIARGYCCCTEGSGTKAITPATARIAAVRSAHMTSASIRQGLSRNTCDAEDGSRSHCNNRSIRHGSPFFHDN